LPSYSDAEGRFSIVATGVEARDLRRLDIYSAAMAFVAGALSVQGDIFAAIRSFLARPHNAYRDRVFSILARLAHLLKTHAAQNIQFHYDRSNEFYAQFLDSRLVYSEAHFDYPEQSLDEAQFKKLERVCQALELKSGESLLDVGCGWGGLITHATEHHGVRALGCTLSKQQLEYARDLVSRRGLSSRVSIEPMDYRDLSGTFDKISSIGMFEHVGRRQLATYFRKIYSLLKTNGLFLNRGLVRPQGVPKGPETLFLQKQVFPGSELVHLSEVICEGERAGFEAISLEDLRHHYALTARAWVRNLQAHAAKCVELVGERTYRTWVLYLAAAAVSLEELKMSAVEVVFVKP